MTMIKRYYPSLAELLSLNDLPENLSFVSDALTNVFGNIHYKDLQVSKGQRGDSASYNLAILTKERLEFNIAGSGFYLVINGDANSPTSSFPVSIDYQWKILGLIKAFDADSFDDSFNKFFEVAKDALGLTEELVVSHAEAHWAIPSTSGKKRIDQLIDDVKDAYDPQGSSLSYPTTSSPISEVTSAIKTELGVDASVAVLNTYLLDSNDTNEQT